jgi:hypothetical protein
LKPVTTASDNDRSRSPTRPTPIETTSKPVPPSVLGEIAIS